ncbi:MAG: helix-turn-helix transcriptional regulator, partial [Thermodesulfobacteriota bacterium]|nr:helix-turn-helix transcriptional regulator [Thermodesulfobacteriota bacterium]
MDLSTSPKIDRSYGVTERVPVLKTRLYIPPICPHLVSRPRLTKKLNEGIGLKLTLISAPAGFGKTTLLSDWVHINEIPVAWLSLHKSDNDPVHFLTYVITTLQSIETTIGKAALTLLKSPQLPPVEYLLTSLINDITSVKEDFALVLDDYQQVDVKPIHSIITFLLDHMPQQMHLIIATRSDPPLPLSRLRSQNQMIELRAADIFFRTDEISFFFNKRMNLKLLPDEISMLDSRTEGWIAGLQLTALSMQGVKDKSGFIKTIKGD